MKLEVEDQDLGTFTAYLALGILCAIERGWVSADAGMSFGFGFYKPLEGKLPRPIFDEASQLDEFHGLPQSLLPASLSRSMDILAHELQGHDEPINLGWDLEEDE